MSATERVRDGLDTLESGLPKIEKLTYRESRVVVGIVKGKSEAQAFRDAGFGESYALYPGQFPQIQLIRSEVERLTERVVSQNLELGLIGATEILEELTEELRGDAADLYDDNDQLKPMREWPLWARQGGVEIIDAPNMVPSADGGGTSWDQVGRKKTIRVVNRAKTRELAMKHRGVNAMVEAKSPELHLHLHQEITQRLQGALARKQRLIEGKTDE